MSKKSTKYKNLVDSKIEVINYHTGTENISQRILWLMTRAIQLLTAYNIKKR